MAKNSFLHPINEVRFGTYKPGDVKQAVTSAIEIANQRTKEILAIPSKSRNYQNTVQALSDSADELGIISSLVSHLSSMLGERWHKADQFVSQKSAAFASKQMLNKKIYNALKEVQKSAGALGLSAAQNRYLNDSVISYERSGIALPKTEQTRLKAILKRLAKLSSDFGTNASKANDKAHLLIKSVDQLSGIDAELVAEWAGLAKQKKLSGYYIPYSPPNIEALLVICSVKKTRQAAMRMSLTRNSKNEALINEILQLRHELAQLLGYKNFVDYVVELRMAKTSKRVRDFADDLTAKFRPHMLREAKELQSFIRTYEKDAKYALDASDVMSGLPLYYASKMRAETLGVDEEVIREYFPLDTVLKGMFDTLKTLYGLTIKPVELPKYHKDVQAYNLYDEKGKHLSTVWCDWFARKGKRSGAWCHILYTADRANGKVSEPHLGIVAGNFKGPSKTKPALLTISDVGTMWHEFGHFIHVSLGRTELREHNGYHTMWDFVEAPSQIMENWVWTDEILARIAKHYKTGKPLPAETVAKLRAARNFRAASRCMWTLYFTVIDQLLHTTYKPKASLPVSAYARKVRAKYFAAPIPIYDHSLNSFLHIFDGGYCGAYYSYLWAERIEADLFSRFEKEGVLNPKTGRDYRDKILALGNQADPDVLVRDFLGRDVTSDAMLQRSGIQ